LHKKNNNNKMPFKQHENYAQCEYQQQTVCVKLVMLFISLSLLFFFIIFFGV